LAAPTAELAVNPDVRQACLGIAATGLAEA
jgi:hypothetical protein